MSIKQGKKYLADKLISIETFNSVNNCCGKHNKYVGWLCKQYIREPFEIGSIKSYIEEYDVLVNKKSINADINSFKTINDSKEEIDKVNSTRSASLKELQTDFDVILDNETLYIARPNSYEASRKLGLSTFAHRNNEQSGNKDSAWCTTYSNSSHWNDYYYGNNVTFYYVKIKEENLIERLNSKYETNSTTCDLTVFAVAVPEDGKLDIYDANDAQIQEPNDLVNELNISEFLNPHIDKEERDKQRRKNIIKLLQQEIIEGNLIIDFDLPNDIVCNTKQINGDVQLRNITYIPKFFKNIIVNGYFACYNNNLTSLEGAPHTVGGNFLCNDNNLTTLYGAPKKVGGRFLCGYNNLTSLEGSPQIVKGSFDCYNNNLTTLEGVPQKVGGDFICYHNQLTSLEGAPKKVGGNFYCNDNKLTSLEGAPQEVGSNFNCERNNLTTLEGAPHTVGGSFYCFSNNLTSLEGAPHTVVGNFMCYHNQLTTLEGAPQKVGGNFYCDNNKLTSLEGAPKKVGGNFWCYNNKFTEEYVEEFQKAVSYEIQS
jgi:hypothetical protein